MSTTTKRPLTPEERAKALRLSALWQKQKRILDLSQEKLSQLLGISQPTLSQYLNGVIPLNTDFIVLISSALQISPSLIDPELAKIKTLLGIRSQISPQQLITAVIGTTSGKRSTMISASIEVAGHKKLEGNFCALAVDTADYEKSGIPKGSMVLLDMNQDPFQMKRTVAYRLVDHSQFVLAQYCGRTTRSLKVIPQNSREELLLPTSSIAAIHLVQAITHPA